jgi:HD superfamily phosphodiesterase
MTPGRRVAQGPKTVAVAVATHSRLTIASTADLSAGTPAAPLRLVLRRTRRDADLERRCALFDETAMVSR